MIKLGALKPRCGKFLLTVGHVLAAKHAELEHLFWRQFRVEIGMEVFTQRFRQVVDVIPLHQIVDENCDSTFAHAVTLIANPYGKESAGGGVEDAQRNSN